MKKLFITAALCLAGLCLAEMGLRAKLFDVVSYSNSESIDSQLRQRNESDQWNLIFVGDSETRWGIDPDEVDAAFHAVGIPSRSFNHAFDGFGPSWWHSILPPLLEDPSMKNVELVAVGVQMVETHGIIADSHRNCGALQKPVLTSSFAIDLGLIELCRTDTWDSRLGRKLFSPLWTVRYSSAVRSMLLPDSVFPTQGLNTNSAKEGPMRRGFEPHRSIGDNEAAYLAEFERWKAQYNPEEHFRELDPAAWENMTAAGGFFDQLKAELAEGNRRLVLFALPTNPLVIDTFRRRNDYHRNSQLLFEWAQANGVIFIDLGIRDAVDPKDYFSDARHLSGTGARLYSRELGEALAAAMGRRGPPDLDSPASD